jgi:hypothetical protein
MAGAPRGVLGSKWLGGNLVVYPGDIAGNVYFVNSGTGLSTNTGKSWAQALATIDQAVNKCTASHDDWIMVHPCHAENLAADSAVDIDKIGITVWGIRHGKQMPTLTNTAAAGDCKLAAAGVTVANIRFSGGVDEGSGIVEISGAYCSLLNCEYIDTTGQATDGIMVIDGADHCLIDGLRYYGAAAAGTNAALAVDGADDIEIKNFYIYGNFAVGGIDFRTTLSARLHVHDGTIWTENAADIGIVQTITACSGTIGPNINIMLQDNAANITTAVTSAHCQMFDPVYVCNLAGEKGMLIGWTASTHA